MMMLSEATKLWRLYSLALGSLVSQPYLGYCKLFQVISCRPFELLDLLSLR